MFHECCLLSWLSVEFVLCLLWQALHLWSLYWIRGLLLPGCPHTLFPGHHAHRGHSGGWILTSMPRPHPPPSSSSSCPSTLTPLGGRTHSNLPNSIAPLCRHTFYLFYLDFLCLYLLSPQSLQIPQHQVGEKEG